MAIPTVIAKNQTGTPIVLPRLGLTAPASPTPITLSDFATFYEISAEEVLQTKISAGDIVLNDGTSDLGITEALNYLDASGNLNGPVSPATNALLKMLDTTGRYTAITGITVDGSNDMTFPGGSTLNVDILQSSTGGGVELPGGELQVTVRNETGGTLTKGSLVYASGFGSGKVLVGLADKDDPAKRPAIGMLPADLLTATNGVAVSFGVVLGLDTSSLALTDQLVLGSAGAFSRPPPDQDPFTGEVQNIGSVVRVDATVGEILINIQGLNTLTSDGVFAVDSTLTRGRLSGGLLSKAGGLDLGVTGGEGFVFDSSFLRVLWSADTLTLPASSVSFIYVDSAGVVQYTGANPDEDVVVLLGTARTNGTDILYIEGHHVPSFGIGAVNHDYFEDVLGPLTVSGGITTVNGGNALSVDVTAATFYITNNKKTSVGATAPDLLRMYDDGGGGHTVVTGVDTADPDFYDDGSGTLAAMPLLDWKKDALYLVQGTESGTLDFVLVYAQETFTTQTAAVAGNLPAPPSDLVKFALRIAGIITQEGTSSIDTITDERPFLGQLSSTNTASVNHGSLLGLDQDDHPQYLLLAGSSARNAVTGTINVVSGVLRLPGATTPAQTAEGSVVWDTDDDRLTVGDGTSRKSLMNQGDAAGGDVGGTFPTSLTVTDFTISGEAQGDVLYFNGTNWVRLPPGTSGNVLTTQGAAANPTWAASAGGGTLQTAYDAGNSIVTAGSTPILFTLTSGGLTVDGLGTVDIGGTSGIQTLNFGTGGSAKTVTVGSTGGSSATNVQSGTGAINIGTSIAKTITVGNSTGATALNLTAGTGNVNTTSAMAWTGTISPTSLSSNQNNYNPTNLSTASTIRQAASVNVSITGLSGGVSGRIIILQNISATAYLTLPHESISSTAANRFSFGGSSVILPSGASVVLRYDGTSSRWRSVGASPGLTGGRFWTHNVFTASSGAAYIRTTSASYETIGHIGFPGTTVAALPRALQVLIRLSGGTSMDIRVYDATNAAVIAELTGQTNSGFLVVDMGTISNVSATGADWEVQQLASGGGGKADCAGLTIQY